MTNAEHARYFVWNYLDRDYTSFAEKTDTFTGDDRAYHFTRHPVATILSWKVEFEGRFADKDHSRLKIFSNGKLIVAKDDEFSANRIHHLTYQMPQMNVPQSVQRVIDEIANAPDGPIRLTPQQEYQLAPYRRIPL